MQTPKELSLRRELKENETQFAILNKKMQQVEEVLDRIADRDNTLYRLPSLMHREKVVLEGSIDMNI